MLSVARQVLRKRYVLLSKVGVFYVLYDLQGNPIDSDLRFPWLVPLLLLPSAKVTWWHTPNLCQPDPGLGAP